jgi:hypothetical protein
MEGRGAYSACRRKGIDEWIIVKAICDWGVSKAGNKAENQIVASESAVAFLRYIFSKPEAFDKLPVKRNNESGLPTGTITDVTKPGASENNEQSRHNSFNVSNNKAENMFVAEIATINGGLNFGRKQ